MAGTADEMKGKAEETVGDLTDDDKLKREGKVDQAAGGIKDKLADAKDWVEGRVDDAKDKLHRDCSRGGLCLAPSGPRKEEAMSCCSSSSGSSWGPAA